MQLIPLAAALGEGLLVKYVIDNRENGMSVSENADWVVNPQKQYLSLVHC